MQLKDIKITSLSITGDYDGSEMLYVAVAWGEGVNEVFYDKTVSTKKSITVQHLVDVLGTISETAGVK